MWVSLLTLLGCPGNDDSDSGVPVMRAADTAGMAAPSDSTALRGDTLMARDTASPR